MENIQHILETKVLGNSLGVYLSAILFYAGLLLALKVLERVVIGKIKARTDEAQGFGPFLISNIEKILIPLLYFAAVYFSLSPLIHDPAFVQGLRALWVIGLSVQTVRAILVFFFYFLEEIWIKKHAQTNGATAVKSIYSIVRVCVWGTAIVFVLDNLGFNVSAIVAGLGIGGVAVALAAQTILGDLFNYFVIFFDKPFELGDFVTFDDYMGHIEHIGLKSTRIRSAGGEQIVISNTNLINSKIRNYKRLAERRVLFKLGITYETPNTKLARIPELIQKIVAEAGNTRFERAYFKEFADFSLNYEIVYFVTVPDYPSYVAVQQKINLQIKETFEREQIEFAYPTSLQYQKQTP